MCLCLAFGWTVLAAPLSAQEAGSDDRTAGPPPTEGALSPRPVPEPQPYVETLPGTKVSFRMVPIPPADGKAGFWMSECEITWEVFDLFIFGIDGARDREGDSVDAYTRPSKPYIPPDRGFGHEGYPVISSSYKNAKQFCRWLTAKTPNHYRLPTVTEWRHAAAAGSSGKWCFGDDEKLLPSYAWFDGNAEWTTHPVRKKLPNAWGLYDVHGNAAEWCVEVGEDGKRRVVLVGGTFEGRAEEVILTALARPEERWQMSDPQIPKSRWWLSDAPFAGLRILRPFPEVPEKAVDPTDSRQEPMKTVPKTEPKTGSSTARPSEPDSPPKEAR